MLRKVANSSNITVGCSRQLTYDEIYRMFIKAKYQLLIYIIRTSL
jgi:hypothetical protein